MKEKRVIYHEFNDEYRGSIVDYLHNNYMWKPIMLTGINAGLMTEWAEEKYKDCILQSSIELRKAKFDYTRLGREIPIDEDITNALSRYALNMLGVLEDSTGWNYSFDERKSYYFDILKYWNTVIHHLKPDILVLFNWPHTSGEYPLYLLCKHYYDIDVVFLDPIPLLDQSCHMIGSSVEKLYDPCFDTYMSTDKLLPSIEVRQYLENVRSKTGKLPNHIIDYYKRNDTKKWGMSFLKEIIILVLKTIIRGTGFKESGALWKKNRTPYYMKESRMNNFQNWIFRVNTVRNNLKLKKIYDGFCSVPDFNKKYLYFTAPYQPEAVTSINAGVYESVFLVLDILSAAVPDDWVIYYKEHPGTFLQINRGSLKRNRYFYERIGTYNNVEMISSEIDSFYLMDNSQAVSSPSGTAGWEAAVRGKPSLLFGNAWYQGCKSIFTINTICDAEHAIDEIVNSFEPDQLDINRYAASIEKVAVKGMIHRNFSENIIKCADPDYEMSRIAEAIKDAHERYYGEKTNRSA